MSAHRSCRPMAVRRFAARRQRGLSLITALLFMVATLILGVSVMSINVMQERMIGNTKDHDLAMQAAEAALRYAEVDASRLPPAAVFRDDCAGGLCTPPSQRATPSALPVHKIAEFNWSTDANVRLYGGQAADTATFPVVARQPRYVIEKLGATGDAGNSVVTGFGAASNDRGTAYRITARAVGARNDTVVILQSIAFCFMGSSMSTPGRMSCIRSLSEETMVARPPTSVAARA